MNHKKFKPLIVMSFILILCGHAFPHWYVNKSSVGFVSLAGTNISGSAVGLENFVVEGAGYFLDSYTYTLQFMKKLEFKDKSDGTCAEEALLLNNALKSMEKANVVFIELKRLADNTPYNPVVIEALRSFDYDRFRAAHNIDDKIFDKARGYLVNGDIRAIYAAVVDDSEIICKHLCRVKSQVDAGIFPLTWDVWNLERAYADSERFGQYVARVFDALGTID